MCCICIYSHIDKLIFIILEMRIARFQGSTRQLNKRIILKFQVRSKIFLEEFCWIRFYIDEIRFLPQPLKIRLLKCVCFFRHDMRLSVHGKYPILNSWHAAIILRHLSSTVAAEIDTILSCCHLASILMWQTCTYTFVPMDNILKEVVLHPRRALYSVTRTQGILYENSSAAPKPNIFIWLLFMIHITLNKMKPHTVHKVTVFDIEKQSGPGWSLWDFVELDIFPQTELLIGEWP